MVIFFFASAAASSAYLTVSETFPLEIRALAIAFFYAIGTGIGGIAGPWLFGALIDTGSRAIGVAPVEQGASCWRERHASFKAAVNACFSDALMPL
jgi:MFS family permease